MRRLWTVFQFELMSYIKNKSFMVMTIIIAVLLFGATFLPRVFDMSEMLGTEQFVGKDSDKEEKDDESEEKLTKLGIVDEKGYFSEKAILEQAFPETEFTYMDSEDELKKAVTSEELVAGFYVADDLNYRYYVLNLSISDGNQAVFDELMAMIHKQIYCLENNLDYETMMTDYEAVVNSETEVLGKDASENFAYCYILVIVIFAVIMLYGVMIATSVTTEKSNRSIEVLVTSIDSTYLLFGKVFAGTFAVVVQVGLIMVAGILGYSINRTYWGGALDMVLDIPASVLASFAVFGIGGFLFYAFLYGAMGALASKTEDINKTSGTLQMIMMIVYFISLFQLDNPEGILMKVCSFLPVSSYSSMFIRIGMGQVPMWEIVVSAVILYASIFFAGWLAAKIYRMGTLRYGNPIKFSAAIKALKEK